MVVWLKTPVVVFLGYGPSRIGLPSFARIIPCEKTNQGRPTAQWPFIIRATLRPLVRPFGPARKNCWGPNDVLNVVHYRELSWRNKPQIRFTL